MTSFKELTTMKVGGPVGELAEVTSTAELVEVVQHADARARPVMILGGGSNMVVADEGFPGLVVRVRTEAVDVAGDLIRADAGVAWDSLVELSTTEGLTGMEPLSGIPGTVGASPVQNVGAYGPEVSELIESLTVYDRASGDTEVWDVQRCGFGPHRQSTFKHTDRYLVLDVTYRLRRSSTSMPLRNADLARAVGVEVGETSELLHVREMVLQLRRSRKFLYDPSDPDTWGVGSFFINPVFDELPAPAAHAPHRRNGGGWMAPAGWFIEHAGIPAGYTWGNGSVGLSSVHRNAVTNRGSATTGDVMAFARHIRDRVEDRFGFRLGPEGHLVGCSFDDVRAA